MRAKQFVTESISDYDFVWKSKREIYAFPKGTDQSDINNAAGWVTVLNNGNGTASIGDITIHKEFRRQGLATEMYKQLAAAGYNIVKSDEVTAMGQSMWAGFNRKGQAKGDKYVTEIKRLDTDSYTGGKDEVEYLPVKKLIPLPGGSRFKYQVDRSGGSCAIDIVATNVDRPMPPAPRDWWSLDDKKKAAADVAAWKLNAKGSKVIGRLALSAVWKSPLPNSYMVDFITVDEDYRGQGLAKSLYGIAISILHFNLVSGDSQTPGGRKNWISLSKIPGCEVVGLLSIRNQHLDPNEHYSTDDEVSETMDSLMSIGCDYLGEKDKKHWFYFPITVSKDEIATAVKNDVEVYHDSYMSGKGWDTFLLARWLG